MLLAPAIEQGIGRAGVKAQHRAVARDQRQVADAAQVEHRTVFVAGTQHRQVEGRHQRRALAAGRHIAPAEIGRRGNAGVFGDPAGVADLPGKGRVGLWPVADGLPVRANRTDLLARHAGLGNQLIGRVCKGQPDLRVQTAQAVDRHLLGALAERDQRFAQLWFPAHRDPSDQFAAAVAGVVEAHQRRIDAVGTGA